jgi:hypothetical protein
MSGPARARWLAEISEALEDAHKLACRLGARNVSPELIDVHARIEAARVEVRSLRLANGLRDKRSSDPEWTISSPWLPQEGHF